MTKSHYDGICMWTGGRKEGIWSLVTLAPSGRTIEGVASKLQEIRTAGYVCHPGCRSIGAPDGPPEDPEFKALGL